MDKQLTLQDFEPVRYYIQRIKSLKDYTVKNILYILNNVIKVNMTPEEEAKITTQLNLIYNGWNNIPLDYRKSELKHFKQSFQSVIDRLVDDLLYH